MARPSLHRPVVTARACAKLNLALAVGPAREGDGFHPIASWMARVDLADDLELTRLESGFSRYAVIWAPDALRRSPIDWPITKDLAVRAHLLLEETVGRPLPVQLKLEKRIPVGGGLGGGSADAAAMLLAVDGLFGLDLGRGRLLELSTRLGSDVAFFLEDGPAIVEGLGERIERTPGAEAHVVLVAPDFACPTPDVYRAFDAAPARPFEDARVRALAEGASVDPDALFNDLLDAARGVRPALAEAMERVGELAGGRRVHLTGSGSALFVVCPGGAGDAADLAARISSEAGDDLAARALRVTG